MKKFNEEHLTETEKNEWMLTFLKRTLLIGGINILLCAFIGEKFYWASAVIVYAVLAISGVLQLYYYRTLASYRIRWFAFWNLQKETNVEPSERALLFRRIAGWIEIGFALAISFVGLLICF